jgi:hypothetical protein
MDKGLSNFLEEISLNLKQTIATIAMGGDSAEVKLDKAIHSCNPKGVKEAIQGGAISRKVSDLLFENMRVAGNKEDPKRLETAEAILNCYDLLDKDREFESGSSLQSAIFQESPGHLKLISNRMKELPQGLKNIDPRICNNIEDTIERGNKELFKTILDSDIIKPNWANRLLEKCISCQELDMVKPLLKKTKDITDYNSNSVLKAAQAQYLKAPSPELKKTLSSILNLYPSPDLKEIKGNKDEKWSSITTSLAQEILSKKKEKLSHAELWGRGGPV